MLFFPFSVLEKNEGYYFMNQLRNKLHQINEIAATQYIEMTLDLHKFQLMFCLKSICTTMCILRNLLHLLSPVQLSQVCLNLKVYIFSLYHQEMLPSLFSSKPRDFSLPNSSWGEEMMRLYEHYNGHTETDGEENQERKWNRLPSYNRSLKYAAGTKTILVYLFFFDKMFQNYSLINENQHYLFTGHSFHCRVSFMLP